jgi:NAD(P)-dependent dehydrogenase (short-subunit alcohol dehydrogenase family)
MTLDLQGKVAVVTGASSGIGEAAARALSAAGAHVVVVARRAERLEALAADDPRVTAHAADVTDATAVAGLADHVREAHGACHVLVNNAGFSRGERFRGEEAVADLTAVLDVNLVGAARCISAFEDLLESSAPSRVINVASVAGKIGVGPPAYAASKFGLVGLSEAMRPDWAKRGVAVCQLNPGFVRTEGFPQDHLMGTPMRRLVITPEEVAEAIVDLARSGARERTVPRWYRGITVARHVAAPAFWGAARKAL